MEHGYETRPRRSESARNFSGASLPNLRNTDFEVVGKESFEIATKIRLPKWRANWHSKGGNKDCTMAFKRLPCFLRGTLLVRGELLIGGLFSLDTAWLIF